MESDNRQLIVAILLQAIEDLDMKGPRCYYNDLLTPKGNRYFYGKKEAFKWLSVSARYYLKKLGLSTVMISKALKDRDLLVTKMKQFLNEIKGLS